MPGRLNRTTKMNISARKPIRLWPGVVIAIVGLLLRFVVPVFAPDAVFIGLLAGLVCALGRGGSDDRRPVRDIAHYRQIARDRGARVLVPVFSYSWPGCRPRRVGRGQPPSAGRTEALDNGCDDLGRVRGMGAGPDRWFHRRHIQKRLALAVDADSRGTAAGPIGQ